MTGVSPPAIEGHVQDSQNQTEEETATLLADKAAAQKHGDLVPWYQFDAAVTTLAGHRTGRFGLGGVGTGGLHATVLGVRAVTQAERDALGTSDGVVVFNSTSGAFEGRAWCEWGWGVTIECNVQSLAVAIRHRQD